VVMGVEAGYLEAALTVLDEDFGGVDAYLENVLGVTPEARAALRARLLE
jgi:protein-tyrosine phosphatase